jgi:hypothetical protein
MLAINTYKDYLILQTIQLVDVAPNLKKFKLHMDFVIKYLIHSTLGSNQDKIYQKIRHLHFNPTPLI